MAVEEIQQSTKEGTAKTAMATEAAMLTDRDGKDVDAVANNSALTTATRTTCLG